ncbi:agmatine deiminase [Micractinium conductrix]|uniref:Agmatine deiminase n=1 Tax=Micractinium conductrix TaxID=554055 RepID=A0A2P6V231_9CHLO|nr:agmatine deiminase [Micractinium conductrix]|eukprot:PSC68147.1 agmatine deiminase [Micractinium conductrix]
MSGEQPAAAAAATAATTAAAAAPAGLGYRMPAEWEPHTRTWMGWPERPDNWRQGGAPAQRAFAAVAAAIAQFEPVTVAANEAQVANARAMLPASVEVVCIPQDDAWLRDTGPTFVLREEASGQRSLGGIDWVFNAWGGGEGGMYATWERDQAVAATVLQAASARRFACPIVMEGGSLHADGEGTLLTTEECLLNPNRNPSLSRDEIEGWLRRMLGVQKVIWLPRGLCGDDDTNGHIDNFACFARPGTVLLAWTDDASDPQHEISVEALRVLSQATDAKGRQLKVVKVPCPPPLHYSQDEAEGVKEVHGSKARVAGDRLAASYINFYLCNGGLVMPAFGGAAAEADKRAQQALAEAFPGRRVVAVPTRDIVLGGGNIHCITQQQPATTATTATAPAVGM